ncbi:glycerate kinase [Bacillus sp. FJAT-47783]|uniref:glycerate kinase family protein n=1 Tax=Bacillus sp. FJAT-47783 TaxID=2922712 RepID=UPI001FADFE2E
MRVVIVIDSFKGCVSSLEASKAISDGVTAVFPNADIDVVPLADGGEGTVEAFIHAVGGQLISTEVTGPLGEKTIGTYGILEDGRTAVIEIAAACGLPLVPLKKRNPLLTTSYGVGELIIHAIENGCRDFIIGLGGSATNDAGVGMLQALGFNFFTRENKRIGLGGKELRNIAKVDFTHVLPGLKQCTFRVACDVTNPLYGNNGAAYVFAPQKGANEHMVKELDEGLKNFANVTRRELQIEIQHIKGAGAAGGLGAAFLGYLNGVLAPGTDILFKMVLLEEKIKKADMIITGEGKIDGQTSMGKAPLGVAKLAKKYEKPVIALAGSISRDEASWLHEVGMTSYFSILNKPMSLDEAMKPHITLQNLTHHTEQLFRLLKTTRNCN